MALRKAHRRTYAREKDLATLRHGRRPRAGRRRSEPEKNNGPCSRRRALPLPVQMRMPHKDGKLEPLYVMWASSLLRSVRGWRGVRERRKAMSCLQRRAGGAVQRGRCYALDSAPGRLETCLHVRFSKNTSESSSRSAYLGRLSPWAERGTATSSQGLDLRSVPVLRQRMRRRVLCPKGRVLHMFCPSPMAVAMVSRAPRAAQNDLRRREWGATRGRLYSVSEGKLQRSATSGRISL